MTTSPGPFDYERHALRWILQRLLGPNQDLETLCKYVPRLANSVANIARAEAGLKSKEPPEASNIVLKALRDLVEERSEHIEEETQW